jgi:hypothetical protein
MTHGRGSFRSDSNSRLPSLRRIPGCSPPASGYPEIRALPASRSEKVLPAPERLLRLNTSDFVTRSDRQVGGYQLGTRGRTEGISADSFLKASTVLAPKLFTITNAIRQMLQMAIGNTTAISASLVEGRPVCCCAVADVNEAPEKKPTCLLLILRTLCSSGHKVRNADFIVMRSPLLASPANTLLRTLFTPHKSACLQRGNQFVGCLEAS